MESLVFKILDRDRNQLIKDQKTDMTLDKARDRASQKDPDEADGYFVDNDLLMHRKFSKEMHNGVKYVDRVVIPESYRNEILRVGHTIPLAGHMGGAKSLNRIAAHFFWPALHFDVPNYCATCPQCQLVARKMKSHGAPLNPVEVETQPFRKIAIDIIGELPSTTTGYNIS